MKRLLNLGVSNPLTLGMAHPVADRIETLGRARPTTWRSRCLALSAMGGIAFTKAPLTMALGHCVYQGPANDGGNDSKNTRGFRQRYNGHS